MALEQWTKDQVIHREGEPIKNLEIVISGRIRMKKGEKFITLNAGSIIGMIEHAGGAYGYSYIAAEDAATYAYPYTDDQDMDKLIAVNQKIAPTITSQTILNSNYFYQVLLASYEEVKKRYAKICQDKKEYSMLCADVGEKAQDFPALDNLSKPPEKLTVPQWLAKFALTVNVNDDRFRSTIYSMGPDICSGFIHMARDLMVAVRDNLVLIREYEDGLNKAAGAFELTVDTLRAKKNAVESGNVADSMPPMTNIFGRVLMYAGVDDAMVKEATDSFNDYKRCSDRGGSSDELRAARRKLAKFFYPVYEEALVRSFDDDKVPPEIKMFLMFGFIDETICTEDQIRRLYGFSQAYRPDPDHRILTINEWLFEVYQMHVEPSRNEFDQDWPTYLRDSRISGDITEAQEAKLQKDARARLHFEITNLFTIGNRMTFGRISAFNPIFDDCNVLAPLDKAYVSHDRIKEELERIRSMDYRIFFREERFAKPEIGINQIQIHKEVLPYIILMPNVGARCVLWQEIEGKKRSSPGRMLFPIFMTEDLTDHVSRVCGEFRWEMCKTEMGIHWNDIHDPSLTAEYADYLQFFKKNSMLNADYKDRVKKQLQKANNNYRIVFVTDYLTYIKFESRAALRLNKVARDILFKYCPFGKEYRDALTANPQYEQHIGKYVNRVAQQARPIQLIVKKLEHDGVNVPKELTKELEYLAL